MKAAVRGLALAFFVFLPGASAFALSVSPAHSPPWAPKEALSPGLDAGGTDFLDAQEAEVLDLINQYRARYGLAALRVSPQLTGSSRWMSLDMARNGYFGHVDSLGRNPFTRMAAFRYGYPTSQGENIAAGNADARNTFIQWRDSPEHNANMLNSSYCVIGVGRISLDGSVYHWYWTTDFGGYDDRR